MKPHVGETFAAVALVVLTSLLIAAGNVAMAEHQYIDDVMSDIIIYLPAALVANFACYMVCATEIGSRLGGALFAAAAMMSAAGIASMVEITAIPISLVLLGLAAIQRQALAFHILGGVLIGLGIRLDPTAIPALLIAAALVLSLRPITVLALAALILPALAALAWGWWDGDLITPAPPSFAPALGVLGTGSGLGLSFTIVAMLILEPGIMRWKAVFTLLLLAILLAFALHATALAMIAVAVLASRVARDVQKHRSPPVVKLAGLAALLPALPNVIGLSRGLEAMALPLLSVVTTRIP